MEKQPPNIDSRLRHILRMPQEIYQASGIIVNGRRLKSFVFTTDLAIIRNCVADGLLRCERIDGKYGVRVAVPDNGQIGREYEALQPAAVDDDAACLIDLLRHTQNVAQAAVDVGGLLFHTRVLLSLFCQYTTKL